MKKWWVKLLLAIVAVALVILALVATSSVHSKNAVERYKDQLRAAGEKLDLKNLIPPHVDADKNGRDFFEQTYALVPSNGVVESNWPTAMKMVAPGKAMLASQQPEIITEYDPRSTNSWADLEHELQMAGPAFDLLRKASERPQLDFELDYYGGATMALPHLSKMKKTALLLSSAVVADMYRADTASAATNLDTFLLLINHLQGEPILISQLVRYAMIQIAVPPQWEFLQSSNVTDAQLAMLQHDWSEVKMVQPMESALLIERASISQNIQQLRTSNSPSSVFANWGGINFSGNTSGDWLESLKNLRNSMKHKAADALWRTSWSYDDELSELKGIEVLVEATRQIRTNGYFKDALAERDRKLAALGLSTPGTNWLRGRLDDVIAAYLGSESILSTGRALERSLACEVSRAMTMTVIALKRYRLRHQTYPGDLKALVPEFLAEVPSDPVDGHPLRYQLNGDGTFLLYSIGSDNIDNGGDPNPAPGSKSVQWQRGRDWVWPLPATPAEVQNYFAHPPK
jgi:hypothetical protein